MFRSVKEFLAVKNPAPSTAETALIAACRAGRDCTLNGGVLPAEGPPDPDLTIRADLIRLLILGGTAECGLHEAGVHLVGAFVTGELDLRFATGRGRLELNECRFDQMPRLDQARLDELSLEGSHLPGLFAQGAQIKGNLFLRRLTATRTVELNGAQIGGQLACEGASLNGGGGDALNAQQAKVGGGLFFRKLVAVKGRVNLVSAHVGDLADEGTAWAMCRGSLLLNGFTYDRISGNAAPKTFALRKDWLARGSTIATEFYPQPYTQFAKVLAASGDAGEARKVLFERDRRLFQAAEQRDRLAYGDAMDATGQDVRADAGRIWLRWQGRQLWDIVTRYVVGYGHLPERALYASIAAILLGLVVFRLAWALGIMVPNSAVIMTSADWLAAVAADPVTSTHVWVNSAAAAHYETFYSFIYALDVFVPLVSLGQESTWAATTVTSAGIATRWFTVAFQAAGWVITSLGIAAITGVMQQGSPE